MPSPKHIGIASITAEGGALAYREIVHTSELLLGKNCHPEISLHSHSFSKFIDVEDRDTAWDTLIVESSRKLASAGAQFFICPANTNHISYDRIQKSIAIPWLHIASVVAERASELGCKRALLLGTQTLMRSAVYPPFFAAHNIQIQLPSETEQVELNRIIYDELVRGRILDSSRKFVQNLLEYNITQAQCDGVILGCTELPLLLKGYSPPNVLILDSTRLIAHGAIAYSLGISLRELECSISTSATQASGDCKLENNH